MATVKRRKTNFDNDHDKYEKESIDVDILIDGLMKNGGTFVEQVGYVSQSFCLSSGQVIY